MQAMSIAPAQRSFRYPGVVDPASLVAGEPNRVSTTRFTPLTWLPKSLFLQFQRAANIYFLFIATIVCMPFSPKRWQSKVFPYILVLAWTCLKDLYEDTRRRNDDGLENARMCWRFSGQGFEQTAWSRLKPGDFVCTMQDEAFPADLLLCSTTGGMAFISTVNLDGETNLKLRTCPSVLSHFAADLQVSDKPSLEASEIVKKLLQEKLEVRLAAPCAELSQMSASLSLSGNVAGAAVESFLPRGCVLRNTAWTLSIVAYAGKDTKQCLNSAKVSGKVSNMQRLLNRCVYSLLLALFTTCLYMATAAKIQDSDTDWLLRFLAYTITLYHVVPISLYVGFEVLKLILGRSIDADPQLCDEKGWAAARTADLVEELGQVDLIFSDKTGTLTANDMRFARCAVGPTVFASFLPDSAGGPIPGVEQAKCILHEQPEHVDVGWFFTCLAVCHTVQVENMTFSGPSPDEVALVQGAHSVGVSFKARQKSNDKEEIVVSIGQEDCVFTIYQVIEFSADRKRMSVLCEHKGTIYCITKGADSVMNPLLLEQLGPSEVEHLQSFSRMGLRTLVVASKEVSWDSFTTWRDTWLTMKASLGAKEQLAQHEAAMERDLRLVGISAVEDKLQDGVPEAINKLKEASIRLWVLTGDKTETAVDIAFSCNLFSIDTELVYMTTSTFDASRPRESIASARKQLEQSRSGLVLDGQTLQWILQNNAEESLYNLAMLSTSCVCSRLSPSQKRKLVEAVRRHSSSITLAIGDGANDVPMILGAHLGIGLRGKEGSQAVQASDIAISQFRFLVPLLMCHGRRAYRRVATFLCYYFYKNVALAVGDLIWAHQSGFSGKVAYPEWLSTSFNAVFTWWPVIFVVAFDRDLSDASSIAHPSVYSDGIFRRWFNLQVFSWWMVSAVLHGSLAWLLPSWSFGSLDYESIEFWRASATSFTMVIAVVDLKLVLMDFRRCSQSCLFPVAGSMLSCIIVLFLLGYVSLGQRMQPNLGGDPPVPGWIFTNAAPLLLITLGSIAALLPDMIALWWVRKLYPSPLFSLERG